jgi:hypothetical protein
MKLDEVPVEIIFDVDVPIAVFIPIISVPAEFSKRILFELLSRINTPELK